MKWKLCVWKKLVVFLRYRLDICLDWLKKTTKFLMFVVIAKNNTGNLINKSHKWILCVLDRASSWYLNKGRPTAQHISDVNTSIFRSLRLLGALLCRLYCAVMTEVYVLIYLSSGKCYTYIMCRVCPCHHGMARPQVADRGTAPFMEGSCE